MSRKEIFDVTMKTPMREFWTVEFDQGGQWTALCYCWSQSEAEKMAAYFRPMQAFSGKTVRARQYGKAAVD